MDEFWEDVLAETARDSAGTRKWFTIRCGHLKRSMCTRCSSPAWTGCGSPDGTPCPNRGTAGCRGFCRYRDTTWSHRFPKVWARKNYAAFSVAPRGKLRSNRLFNPGYPGLLTYGMVDRNIYSYRGFYMDACRAVEFPVGSGGS